MRTSQLRSVYRTVIGTLPDVSTCAPTVKPVVVVGWDWPELLPVTVAAGST